MEINELTSKIEDKGALEVTVELLKEAGLNEFEANFLISALLDECKDFKH